MKVILGPPDLIDSKKPLSEVTLEDVAINETLEHLGVEYIEVQDATGRNVLRSPENALGFVPNVDFQQGVHLGITGINSEAFRAGVDARETPVLNYVFFTGTPEEISEKILQRVKDSITPDWVQQVLDA